MIFRELTVCSSPSGDVRLDAREDVVRKVIQGSARSFVLELEDRSGVPIEELVRRASDSLRGHHLLDAQRGPPQLVESDGES